MAGFIFLDDGRGFRINSGGFVELIRLIAETIPTDDEGKAFVAWLYKHDIDKYGASVGIIDIRELTPDNQQRFRVAIQKAFIACQRDWPDDGFTTRFRDLLKMMKSIRRGEPPETLNHQEGVKPWSRQRSGPGWPEPAPLR